MSEKISLDSSGSPLFLKQAMMPGIDGEPLAEINTVRSFIASLL